MKLFGSSSSEGPYINNYDPKPPKKFSRIWQIFTNLFRFSNSKKSPPKPKPQPEPLIRKYSVSQVDSEIEGALARVPPALRKDVRKCWDDMVKRGAPPQVAKQFLLSLIGEIEKLQKRVAITENNAVVLKGAISMFMGKMENPEFWNDYSNLKKNVGQQQLWDRDLKIETDKIHEFVRKNFSELASRTYK